MLKVAIIVSFIAIQCLQIGAAKPFTAEEYIGKWEDVGSIGFSNDYARVLCSRRDVTRADDGHVIERYSFIFNEEYNVMNGSVEISNSEMNIIYTRTTLTYGIECYDNCNDLIFFDRQDKMASLLVSRNVEPSEDAKSKFEELAKELGGFVYYSDNSNCDSMAEQILCRRYGC